MKRIVTTAATISMAVILTTAAATLAAPASAVVASHSSPAVSVSASASEVRFSRAQVTPLTGAASLDAAMRPDTTAVSDSLAINAFTIPLTGNPNPQMQTECEPPQYGTIILAAGDYEWNLFLNAQVLKTVKIPLESGYYTWNDCIMPEKGYYVQFSILCPPDADPSTPCVRLLANDWIDSGTYYVGSWLERLAS